jgi:predicted secreted hydrolase
MGVVSSGTLHHTCFVVNDVEKTATALAESLGIGPWSVFTIEPAATTVRGRDVPFSFRIAIARRGLELRAARAAHGREQAETGALLELLYLKEQAPPEKTIG